MISHDSWYKNVCSTVLHETVTNAPLIADFNQEQEEFIKSKGGKEQVFMFEKWEILWNHNN